MDKLTELSELRRKIDEIDKGIMDLLNRRASIALQIGNIKQEDGRSIRDTLRELEVIDMALSANRGPMPDHAVRKIFADIIAICRNLQLDEEKNHGCCNEG